jgi:Bacterial protein of unknown function (Gcw_chp)
MKDAAVEKGLKMHKVVLSVLAAVALASPALAADLKMLTKAPPPPPSPWDFAFGSALMSDYEWRGISQSEHRPSAAAYFEPRYNFTDSLQGYVGTSGESIDFPNRAAAEIDFYGGIRPTFGKVALDFGAWYYYYPGGNCFNTVAFCSVLGNDPATFMGVGIPIPGLGIPGNVVKNNISWWEVYGKGTWTVTDQFSVGGSLYYSPSVANSGAWGTYAAGTAKYVLPATPLPFGIGAFISGDVGYWWFGTTDAFYGLPGTIFAGGIPYKNFANWDVGFALTKSVFTLDFRYYDSNLSKGDCNAFTSDQNAAPVAGAVTPINPAIVGPFALGSRLCSATFVVKMSADLTLANVK